jgi:hypothetical protein
VGPWVMSGRLYAALTADTAKVKLQLQPKSAAPKYK